jgi:hypothetical protein
MSLIALILILAVFGLLLWLVTSLPLDPNVKRIIQVVALIGIVLWLLNVFGLLGSASAIRIGPHR